MALPRARHDEWKMTSAIMLLAQGLFSDSTILDMSEVELVDLKFLDDDPIIVAQFNCQQVTCWRPSCVFSDRPEAICHGCLQTASFLQIEHRCPHSPNAARIKSAQGGSPLVLEAKWILLGCSVPLSEQCCRLPVDQLHS
jgi:hypothetical protein